MSKLVSIRLDDDVLDVIEHFEGKTFTEKFHNLIRFKDKEFKSILSDYKFYKSERERFRSDLWKQRELLDRLHELSVSVNICINKFNDYDN